MVKRKRTNGGGKTAPIIMPSPIILKPPDDDDVLETTTDSPLDQIEQDPSENNINKSCSSQCVTIYIRTASQSSSNANPPARKRRRAAQFEPLIIPDQKSFVNRKTQTLSTSSDEVIYEVAIVAEGGTYDLTKEEAGIIETNLTKAVNDHHSHEKERAEAAETKERLLLKFVKTCWESPGFYVVTCLDFATFKWICKWDPGVINGMQLSVVPSDEIPWPKRIGFFVKCIKKPNPEKIKLGLSQQNDVEAEIWRLDTMEETMLKGEESWFLTFMVPDSVPLKLQKQNWRVYYGMKYIEVCSLRPKSSKAVKKRKCQL